MQVFAIVNAVARSRSADLIADDRFVPAFKELNQFKYFNGESDGNVGKFVAGFLHGEAPFEE